MKVILLMSYKSLEIWQMARSLSIDIHKISFLLPKYDQMEEGRQIRRSIKSVRSNIVEGYGRRVYKADYCKFIIYALASNDETIDHLEILHETGSLQDVEVYNDLHARLEVLGKKINNFLIAISKNHKPGLR